MDITIDGQKTTVKLNGEVVNHVRRNQPFRSGMPGMSRFAVRVLIQATSACKTTTAHRRVLQGSRVKSE